MLRSRLKLLGLAVISSSIILGLVLSIAGVDAVRLHGPTAKQFATWLRARFQPADEGLNWSVLIPAANLPQPSTSPGLSGASTAPVQPTSGMLQPDNLVLPPNMTAAPSLGTPPVQAPSTSWQPQAMPTAPALPSLDNAPSPWSAAVTLVSEEVKASQTAGPLTIPLWSIVGVAIAAGFGLWSLPIRRRR